MRRMIAFGAAAATAAAATAGVVLFTGSQASAATSTAHAVLRDASGKQVAEVTFSRHAHDGSTLVEAIFFPDANVTKGAFHGFHIHANNDPATGAGCKADPTKTSDTWFLSADGHLSKTGQTHSSHQGDMPSVLIQRNGSAHLVFTSDRFTPGDLVGKAVVVHAKPDNFGNVPVGDAADQYTANKVDATTKTAKTGNAGDRVACGVIRR